ncbi:CPXCG motif-containing cysteine-rich protein [Hydrogenimonas sp.]
MIEHFFVCPYCWQRVSILIDEGVGRFEGIEDCEVCCNPIPSLKTAPKKCSFCSGFLPKNTIRYPRLQRPSTS